MSSKPKILVVDIETSPATFQGWGMFKQNFSVEQVIEYPTILCIGFKWIGQSKVHMYSQWEHGTEAMLLAVKDALNEADAVVSKNGIRFDIPWINTELLKYKLGPFRPLTHIDLEKVARFKFRFLSNKLEYILQYLDIGHKMDTGGHKLWRKVLEGNFTARAKMLRYCAMDIRGTERAYKTMLPFISDHPTLRAVGAEACPTCQSRRTKKDGFRYTRYFKTQLHQCLNPSCGQYFSGKKTKAA